MARSTLTAAAWVLLALALAACQVTDSLFGAADDGETVAEPAATEPEPSQAALPAYQPPAVQQPVYQQGPYPPPYQQPPYQQSPYPPPAGGPPYPPTQGFGPSAAGYPPPQGFGGVPSSPPPGFGPSSGYPPPQGFGATPGSSPHPDPAGDPNMVARGEYLVTVSGCSDCHTDGALVGDPTPNRYLAGTHIGINVDGLGIMYPPNITPDRHSGIGNWSVYDIARALREGIRPDGSEIRAPMPIAKLSQLTEEDAMAIAAYLKTVRPIDHVTNRNPVAKSRANYPYVDVIDVKMAGD